MKLVLCLEYGITQHGGTEVLVTELIRGLSVNHKVVLVSDDDASTVAQSSVVTCLDEHIPWRAEPASPGRSQILANRIARTNPDLVHFHLGGSYGWSARAFNKCPIVHVLRKSIPTLSTNHGAFSLLEGYCWERRHFLVKLGLLPMAWLSKQYVLSFLHTEVAVSQNDFRKLKRRYPAMRSKFRWIYHSRIRESHFTSSHRDREKVILCAGTIGPRKGQTYLVEAFCRLASRFPDWRLVLIGREGDAAMGQAIRERIATSGLAGQVLWLGSCSDAELQEWLKKSAIFAMPSLSEGLGLSLQEAQFYGCACVGTSCGGVTDLIEDGYDGLLVPPGKAEPLAEALEKLMNDPVLRTKLSEEGARSVLAKGMTAGKMVTAYEQLYREILGSRP